MNQVTLSAGAALRGTRRGTPDGLYLYLPTELWPAGAFWCAIPTALYRQTLCHDAQRIRPEFG
ncbi:MULTISPECIES: hypothetical protein [Cupriavidus]|uniref:hypothetical protein n=1 Tax=Cupriavidus TaxID=106589 RepID=UPI00112D8543|nr:MULTISPECIES: hypothetical protein [Cupriavidus]QYY32186.1 hypothetical protein K2O51_15445 [Cupriavidus pinatubonensis]